MNMVRLGDICEIESGGTPLRSNLSYWENGNIPWAKISDIKGKYLNKTEEYITELGLKNSSAKIFKKGTILYTIFATLGEVCILNMDTSTNQAIASIRIIDNNVNTNYLYYHLLSLKLKVNNIGRGVAQNNINMKILKDFKVTLPPLEEQKRIANILDKVTELIQKRKQQLDKLDLLVKAKFVEMFGDPVKNSFQLPLLSLKELGVLNRGISKHRPRNAPELLGGKYPLIQTGDVSNTNLFIKEYSNTYSELGLKQSKMWKSGTLCITIAANIAKTAILTFDACFPDSIVGFIANDKTNNIFMHYWFVFFQKILEEQAPESAQKNINLKILNELRVINPNIKEQNQFAKFVEETEKVKIKVNESLEKLETLKKALMQEYFN